MDKDGRLDKDELRDQIRHAAAQGASVEFKPSATSMPYRLMLRDWSASGLGILVRKDSQICSHIAVGQVFPMTVFKKEDRTASQEHVKVEIRHISPPEKGQHPDHLIIGLRVLEKLA